MILCVAHVLSSVQLTELSTAFAAASFKESARHAQLSVESPAHAQATQMVRKALLENETLQAAALPLTLSAMSFGRMEPGMTYGPKSDSGIVGQPPMRADLAFTLFLTEPSSSEGGELVLLSQDGDEEYKLPAGALVLHPASSVHRMRPVRSGQHLICSGWIQSLVRDPRVREMLFDLSRVKHHLFREQGSSELFDLVAKTQSNLLRMHAEV